MGLYLNPKNILTLYKRETQKPYFVDKTKFLGELIPLVEQEGSNIAVTRPRRFGKSVMASMIASFFNKGVNSEEIFSKLKISENSRYSAHINQHNVIFINFSKGVSECTSYEQYINYFKQGLSNDIRNAYPDVPLREGDTIGSMLRNVSEWHVEERFIIVLDEWDYVFHRDYFTEEDRGRFTGFLGDLTKDQPYVELTYLTGVLPIKKYSISDTMNHFDEYNTVGGDLYSNYFGFTEEDVDELFHRYLNICPSTNISRAILTEWYDGYHCKDGKKLYNPNSVVSALTRNIVDDYWAKAGEFEELKDYVLNDTDGVKEAIMLLIAGEPVKATISEYATAASVLKRRDAILSVMTIYGYLDYYNGYVRIPNKELQIEFETIIQEEPRYSYMHELEKESSKILQATYDGDTDTIADVLSFVHNSESPLKSYNDEAELSGSVKLAYIAARNKYDMQREDQAGIGYVDYIFYPYNRSDDGIIIELKVDDTPENALKQIHEKKYAQKFKGKIGEQPKTTGRIILVGIGYSKKNKEHRCIIEVL